jgi:hypothetical protein
MSSNEYVITAPSKTKKVFSFTGDPVAGEKLRINSPELFPDASYFEMTFVTTLSATTLGFQIKTKAVGQTQADWIESNVVAGLIANPYISNKYNIYADGENVVIEAMEYGPSYDFSMFEVFEVSSGFDIDVTEDVAGVTGVFEDNFQIRVRLNLETEQDSQVFTRSEWFFYRPNQSGAVTIDLSDKADAMFQDLQIVASAAIGAAKNLKSARRFFIEASDHFGDEPFTIASQISAKILLMKGSIRFTSPSPEGLQAYVIGGNFITKKGVAKHYIGRSHAQFLSFIVATNPASESIIYKAKVYYTDGTTADHSIATYTTIAVGDLWTAQAGFTQNGLQNIQPAKTAYKYELWFEGAITLSQMVKKHTLWLQELAINSFCIFYHNFAGCWETRSVISVYRERTAITRSDIRKARPLTYSYSAEEYESFDITAQGVIELSTGAFNKFDADAVYDLLLSKKHQLEIALSSNRSITLLPSENIIEESFGDTSQYQAAVLIFKINSKN